MTAMLRGICREEIEIVVSRVAWLVAFRPPMWIEPFRRVGSLPFHIAE
jgi:hypothetical protein